MRTYTEVDSEYADICSALPRSIATKITTLSYTNIGRSDVHIVAIVLIKNVQSAANWVKQANTIFRGTMHS